MVSFDHPCDCRRAPPPIRHKMKAKTALPPYQRKMRHCSRKMTITSKDTRSELCNLRDDYSRQLRSDNSLLCRISGQDQRVGRGSWQGGGRISWQGIGDNWRLGDNCLRGTIWASWMVPLPHHELIWLGNLWTWWQDIVLLQPFHQPHVQSLLL